MSDKKLVKTWNEGFAKNNSPATLKSLRDRIDQFNALFSTVRKGDVILINYLPDDGTQVWINGSLKGMVPGRDFNQALLKIWLGDKPADENLKKAWLGKR